MQIDARSLPTGSSLEADVCVIGAGAAGITLALELAGSGLSVCLLESGGFEPDERTQALYAGEVSTPAYAPLESSRLRFFGGTTNHWTGWCGRWSPFEFEARDWVPHSGWPLGYQDLAPYYDRAEPLLELPPAPRDLGPAVSDPERRTLDLDPRRIRTRTIRFSPPTRFGRLYRERLVAAPDVKLVLHANVTRIQRAVSEARVTHVDATSLDGPPFRVRARAFALATGGVENARLLLASNDVETAGLGNGRDRVGRYYMDHLGRLAGMWFLEGVRAPLRLYARGRPAPFKAVLALAPEAQRRAALLGVTFRLLLQRAPAREDARLRGGVPAAVHADFQEDFGAHALAVASRLDGRLLAADEPTKSPPINPRLRAMVHCEAEQEPDPSNRVVLAGERDALGVPRASLEWRPSPHSVRTIEQGLQILGVEIGRVGLGRLGIAGGAGRRRPPVRSGTHPMGATRMAADPSRGFVDPDCRVHGLANLYVAGSSVFPTGGTRNPTLTLTALAIRLADHLKATLRSRAT